MVALSFVAGGLLSVLISFSIAVRPLIDDMSTARQPEDGLVDPTLHTSGLYAPGRFPAGAVRALIDLASWKRAQVFAWAGLLLTVSAYAVSALWLLEPKSVNAELTALHTSYVNRWGSAGLWLRDSTPGTVSTAAKGAGAIAYYSRRPVIDVYGLNDLYIGHLEMPDMGSRNAGHDKEDPTYVLDKRPGYILDEWLNYFQPVKSRLKEEYEYLVARTPTGPELAWWKRK